VHWSRPFPIIIAFAQQRRARLPHPLSLAFLTGPCFDASSSLRSRSGPQSCSPLDQAHPLRGSRDFYTRAFLTAGHPTAKSGITTQLSGLLLRVGIELERAHRRRRVSSRALSIARWGHNSTIATSPEAPLRSCTVGFPEYSSDLGFPPEAFPTQGRLKRWLAYTPPRVGLPPGSSFKDGSSDPRR
jgi:hypothetical protein